MENIKNQGKNIKIEVQERTLTYLTAAFGLVVGLAWNDAVKAFIEFVFPIQKNTLWAKFGYAFALTIIFVLITIYIAKVLNLHTKIDDTDSK